MNKIDKLIKEKCPNGVEYKKLCSVIKVLRGKRLTKSELNEFDTYPVYHGGLEPLGMYKQCNRHGNSVMIINVGASAGTVGYSYNDFWSSDGCYTLNSSEFINNRFLYHLLKNKENDFVSKVRHAGIPTLDAKVIENIKIPVPPIEIQEEIVKILDKFSKLEAELEAELEARKQQYDFWRGRLFEDNSIQKQKVSAVFKRLKGTPITAGKMKEIANEKGDIRIFAGGRTVVDTLSSNIPQKNIINIPSVIVQSRGFIDFIYYDKPFSFKNEMWAYTCDNSITIKYLFYYLKSNVEYFRTMGSQMGSMPQISLPVTDNFEIFIPTLTEQKKIVNILDKFDKLINDISEGIPAEILLRRKQYEYYRNKLLNFREV